MRLSTIDRVLKCVSASYGVGVPAQSNRADADGDDKRQETRDKRQETRDKRQETRR